MYQLPVSPKSPSIPPTSPNGRPVHLQPIEANGRISHMPTTPSKSNLGPVGKATGNVSMHKSNSDISLASLQQQQPQQQQQSDADNIKVVVRIRPLFSHEASKGATQIAEVSEGCSSLKVQANKLFNKHQSCHSCYLVMAAALLFSEQHGLPGGSDAAATSPQQWCMRTVGVAENVNR
eukprot:GHRR01013382.1.p1 GENE.GHRR01013382.1~~GHRR01013382.1.p1  ORF type:complete len:178 (+),score=47.69 GHRR01013382.1:1082-1615(+)